MPNSFKVDDNLHEPGFAVTGAAEESTTHLQGLVVTDLGRVVVVDPSPLGGTRSSMLAFDAGCGIYGCGDCRDQCPS